MDTKETTNVKNTKNIEFSISKKLFTFAVAVALAFLFIIVFFIIQGGDMKHRGHMMKKGMSDDGYKKDMMRPEQKKMSPDPQPQPTPAVNGSTSASTSVQIGL